MNISIVMAYFNRKELLYNTMKSIEHYWPQGDHNEIIVVDDASDDGNDIAELKDVFNLDIKIISIKREEKIWINPCIPFNIGFSKAKNDIIIIQNPECIHHGNIIKYTLNNIKENTYLNYACYSIDKRSTERISYVDSNSQDFMRSVSEIVYPLVDSRVPYNGTNGWYNHSVHKPHQLHFCSAIMRKDLYDLGGFDERYANGLGYDDNEFLERIRKKQMMIESIDDSFVIHQYHVGSLLDNEKSYIKYAWKMHRVNMKLFDKITLESDNYDVKMYNDYYT